MSAGVAKRLLSHANADVCSTMLLQSITFGSALFVLHSINFKIATNAMMLGCRGVLYTLCTVLSSKGVLSTPLQTRGKYQLGV